jgi:hypothetical protein
VVAAASACLFAATLTGPVRSDAADDGSKAQDQSRHGPVPLELFRAWNFDKQAEGDKPSGFTPYTLGDGSSAIWLVERDAGAPSMPNIVRQTAPCSADPCVHVLAVDDLVYEYPDVSVRLRLAATPGASGEAGLAFAVHNRTNFYAATVDSSGKAVEVRQMIEGQNRVLGRAPIIIKNLPWHALRVRRNTIISKEYIEVFFDGVHVLSIEEKTMSPGQIGLLTAGAAMVAFDNLNAAPLYSQKPLSPPAAY